MTLYAATQASRADPSALRPGARHPEGMTAGAMAQHSPPALRVLAFTRRAVVPPLTVAVQENATNLLCTALPLPRQTALVRSREVSATTTKSSDWRMSAAEAWAVV